MSGPSADDMRKELASMRMREELAQMRAADEQIKPIGPSKGESAMRGAAKGMLSGFSDELYGVVGGALNPADIAPEKGFFEGFPDRYAASRDYARMQDAKARDANPGTFGAAELGASIASPVNRALGAAPTATVRNVMTRGAIGGALAGAGESNASPTSSPDSLKQLAFDTAGGAALGGAMAGVGKAVASGMKAVTPDAVRQFGDRRLLGAATGQTEEGLANAGMLGQADEAGDAAVGWLTSSKQAQKNVAEKAQHFAREADRVAEEVALARDTTSVAPNALLDRLKELKTQAKAYGDMAAQQKPAEGSRSLLDKIVGAAGFASSMMHGGNTAKNAATAIALGGATKLARDRGGSVLGHAAHAGADLMEAAPEIVGTAAGAVQQYLHSGVGANAVTQQALGLRAPSAEEIRRDRMRQAMIKRVGDLREQGYQMQSIEP